MSWAEIRSTERKPWVTWGSMEQLLFFTEDSTILEGEDLEFEVTLPGTNLSRFFGRLLLKMIIVPFPGLVGYTSSCKVEWICLLNIDLWWSMILSLMPKKPGKPDCWWVYWTVLCCHCSLKDWNRIHPWKQTWNLNIPSWKRRNIYKPPIVGFHVKFLGE